MNTGMFQVRGADTLNFACYRGSDYFLGFKIFDFAIFGGCRGFVNYFMDMPILAGIFGGMPFSTVMFWGCQFKNVDCLVFLLYKVQ